MKRIEVSDYIWLIFKLWKWDNIEYIIVLVSEKYIFKSIFRLLYIFWIVFIEWCKWFLKWRYLKIKLKRINVFIWLINGCFLKEWGSLFVCVEEKLFLYGKCVVCMCMYE